MSPFDITKSITTTKVDLCDNEELFVKEYVPYMVNKILSNSPQTVLYAGMMNQLSCLSKQMQYKFLMKGIPKSNSGYSKYIKKETSDIDKEHLDFICESMNLSIKRAIEVYNLLGIDVVKKELLKRGGRK